MTMYEKLMTLPMFKGLSQEHLMELMEKTDLNFCNYSEGQVIVNRFSQCDRILCLISGKWEYEYIIGDNFITLQVDYGPGKVVGLNRLYGMDQEYGYNVTALQQCSVLEFTKPQYMKMIESNHICLINFLNYLSFGAQRHDTVLLHYNSDTYAGRLWTLVVILTDKDAGLIRIRYNNPSLFESSENNRNGLQKLMEAGVIEYNGKGMITINSRIKLSDYIESVQVI